MIGLPTLFPVGTAIQSLGLAIMVGGMLALGAFTAPVLFKQFARPEAGEAMTMIFRRFDTLLLVALLFVVVGEVCRGFSMPQLISRLTMLSGFRYGLIVALAGLMIYSISQINPQIEGFQKQRAAGKEVDNKTFTQVHELSEKLYRFEMFIALLLLVTVPFISPPSPGEI